MTRVDDDWVRALIVIVVGTVTIMLSAAIVLRSIFADEIDPQVMLAVWNPIIALLGGLVGYVAGRQSNNGS